MILFYLTIWIDGIIECVRSKIDESYQQGSNLCEKPENIL
jgi:hypothetical protein